jgi:hypothetical protein
MAEERLLGNSFGDLGGTLFSRCFWYTIIPVLTVRRVDLRESPPSPIPKMNRGGVLHVVI